MYINRTENPLSIRQIPDMSPAGQIIDSVQNGFGMRPLRGSGSSLGEGNFVLDVADDEPSHFGGGPAKPYDC